MATVFELKEKIAKYEIKITTMQNTFDALMKKLGAATNDEEKWQILDAAKYPTDKDSFDYEVRSIQGKIHDLQKRIKNIEEKAAKENAMENKRIQVITDFLDEWGVNFLAYLKKDREQLKQLRQEYSGEELRRRINQNISRFNLENEYVGNDWETYAKRYMESEKRAKESIFYKRIEELAGEIKEAHLHIGDNGEINGFVQGTKNAVRVTTISAGGYNIQRFHYRVLVTVYTE